MSLWQLIAVLFVSLLAEGFFTGTELAVVHADKLKLRGKAGRGSATAKLALWFQANPGWFFSATLLGTNLALVTASVCTTYYIMSRFGEAHEGWALLLAPVTLVFGEIVPKSLYQHYANQLIPKIVYPVKFFGWLFYPVVWVLTKLNDLLLSGFSRKLGGEPMVTREELEILMKEPQPGESETAKRTLVSRIFDLADKKISHIMIPLVDVEAIPLGATRDEALMAFEESGHSRLPVFQGRLVNIVGVLHNIDYLLSEESKEIKEVMRPAYYVPEGMPLDDLFLTMKRRGEPMAIVVDEFGGASGLVTLEDLIEQVVGEIHDEYDEQPPLYYRIGKNRFLVGGRLEIAEANDKLKLGIPSGHYGTVAGFLIHLTGSIPQTGAEIPFGNLKFIVLHATERAIQEVEIRVA